MVHHSRDVVLPFEGCDGCAPTHFLVIHYHRTRDTKEESAQRGALNTGSIRLGDKTYLTGELFSFWCLHALLLHTAKVLPDHSNIITGAFLNHTSHPMPHLGTLPDHMVTHISSLQQAHRSQPILCGNLHRGQGP